MNAITEKDAATKWCPFSSDRRTPCIGANCMAWRWWKYQPVPSSRIEGQDEATGYCGLAGRLA